MNHDGGERRPAGPVRRADQPAHGAQFDLDDEKIEAIKSCLEKGRLSIHFSNVDLSQTVGRLGDPYLYD